VKIIERAKKRGQKTLSEYESKRLLSSYGIPITKEKLVKSKEEAVKAAIKIGFPVVLKGCGPKITHKTELNLIELDLKDEKEVKEAYKKISNTNLTLEGILVQEQIKGERELVIGLKQDPTFGPCVMFGLGGIFTEVLKDVTFRVAPLKKSDAREMIKDIKGYKILEAFRGSKPVDQDLLGEILIKVGQIGLENKEIKEIDINPLIVKGEKPVAVDALIVLKSQRSMLGVRF